jgi:hypothetical protein
MLKQPTTSFDQRIIFMKTLFPIVSLSLIAFALIGCNGIKASTDNATVTKGAHFDSEGKVTDKPDVSVPFWKSDGLKPKPVDVTPEKSQGK